jgi:hypothetical protein
MRYAIKMLGLASVLSLSACGGGGGERFGMFLGTWRANAGTVTTACPGHASTTDALTGSASWSAGVSSDLVSMTDLTSCPLMADVTGSTASGVPGQSCTESDGFGGSATFTFAGYTFVLSPDGHTATENSSGQVTVVDQGVTLVCSFNESGSYQKISK